MRNIKLISLLKTFTIRELKNLLLFSESPYFNKNAEITLFLSSCIKAYPNWEEKKISEEFLFKKVYPNEKFDKEKIYHLRSHTLKLVEKFILHESVESNKFMLQQELVKHYRKHNIQEYFEQEYKNTEKLLASDPRDDGEKNYQHFLLSWEWVQNQAQISLRTNDMGLNEVHQYLDIFYVINKLSLFLSSLSLKKVIQVKEIDTIELTHLLQLVDGSKFIRKNPTIHLLSINIKLLLYPNEEQHLVEANELLFSNEKILPKDAFIGLSTHLRNHYIAQMNKGEQGAVENLLKIYKLQLKDELLFNEKGEILGASFRNIVAVAITLKEYKWVKEFIEKYQHFLPLTQKEDILAYSWAKYFFCMGNYTEVLKSLSKMLDYPDTFFDIQSRKLLMQTYYELSEMENVLNALNTFRVYLSRNQKISEHHKTTYLNFASAINRLCIMDWEDDKKVEHFYQSIIKMDNFSEKTWFFNKIQEKRGYSLEVENARLV